MLSRIFAFIVVLAINCQLNSALDPDANKGAVALIKKYGYPVEEISITSNGYILKVHRIPHGLENENDGKKKTPVLIMHDILSSSADFVNMGNRSMAFRLADEGYDVWIANARGNTHSKTHETLDSAEAAFWNFSWDEMGNEDLPNMINYIKTKTGFSKILYVGHGQGTTAFFAMATLRPEFNDDIALSVALAPVVYNRYLPNPLLRMVDSLWKLHEIMDIIPGPFELLPNSVLISMVLTEVCNDYAMLVELCAGFMFLMYGFDSAQLDRAKVPVILTNAAAGASSKQFHHYAQLFYTDNFTRFDYGTDENLKIYGQEEPPSYDLSIVTAPVAIFYGTNDWLSGPKDVQRLAQELPNVVANHRVLFDDFNHMDFLFAKEIERLVYKRMFELMREYAEE